jgi:hypothetical protein
LLASAAFFAAQYLRIASIWRCLPSGEIVRFFALVLPLGLPRRLGCASPTSRSAANALLIALSFCSNCVMMFVISFKVLDSPSLFS